MGMILFFKHLAVRVWTALFFGALATLVLLPPFAGAIEPAWMIVPGIAFFVVAFWLTGVVFAALGRRRLNRLMGEAGVWERAGMDREARGALARAEATVDSFFFSPFSRRKPADRLLAQVARFQLAFEAPESVSDRVIGAYLRHFPGDREAAAKWLDRVLTGGVVNRRTHDIASRIGAMHPEDPAIQRLLAQLYIDERRCDFTALQTYRQVVEFGQDLPQRLIDGIADLFLSQQRADGLALLVYLDRYESGDRDRRLLPGIAGCVRLIHPTPLTLPLLQRADSALGDIDARRRQVMADAFLPDTVAGDTRPDGRPPRSADRSIGSAGLAAVSRGLAAFRDLWTRLGRMAGWTVGSAGRLLGILRITLAARQTRSLVKWTALGVFVVAVGWLVVSTVTHLGPEIAPTDTPPEPLVVPVSDPFTLQVAAYLKSEDAQRFVAELKDQGLDAYWTRATGGNRTWFQVRLSHFKTKAEARAYGEQLKKRHVIDDYYVANYKRPDVR